MNLRREETRLDATEPQELSLFESGVILVGCIIGMVLMVIVSAALNACGVW